MNDTARFAHDQNVSRFVDRLRHEADGGRREVLRQLLIEEEERLGALYARLGAVDMQLADCAARIAQQRARIAELTQLSADTDEATRLLRNLEDIQTIFCGRRTVILDGLRHREN